MSTTPPKPHAQRERQRGQLQPSSSSKLGHAFDTGGLSDLMTSYRAARHSNTSPPSLSSASSCSRSTGPRANPIKYPNYYDQSDNDAAAAATPTHQDLDGHLPKCDIMATMAMQVPGQQQQLHGRLVDSCRSQAPITTQQIAQSTRNASSRGSRPPSYSGSQHGTRSSPPDDDTILPPNKVDIDAARYRQSQQRRLHQPAKDARPATNGSSRPPSSSLQVTGNSASPESPGLSPAANIRRLPTPSVAMSVLQPLEAKVSEYGTLMAEAQAEMARLDEEMRQLQERQREAEQRYLDAKNKHDEYRRQHHDVERALRGDLGSDNGMGMGMGMGMDIGTGTRDTVPPDPSMSNLNRQNTAVLDGGRMPPTMGGPPPAMRSQRTVSAHSEQPSMMSQDSTAMQKRGRFSRLFGI